jgi:hypothetical protein
MQDNIAGQFLNGQSLYLKVAEKVTSASEGDGVTLEDF